MSSRFRDLRITDYGLDLKFRVQDLVIRVKGLGLRFRGCDLGIKDWV